MAERKSARELGIKPREMEALLWVRDAIDPAIPDKGLPDWIVFDMRDWGSLSPGPVCRTACCIGGSMSIYMAGLGGLGEGDRLTQDQVLARVVQGEALSYSLDALFYVFPYQHELRTRELTTAAIDRFLSGETYNPWLVKNG